MDKCNKMVRSRDENVQNEAAVKQYMDHLHAPWLLCDFRMSIASMQIIVVGKNKEQKYGATRFLANTIGIMLADLKREEIDQAPNRSTVRDRWRSSWHVCKCEREGENYNLTWYGKWAFCKACNQICMGHKGQ